MWGRHLTGHMTEDRILWLHHGEGTVGRQWGQQMQDWEENSGGYTGQLWGF